MKKLLLASVLASAMALPHASATTVYFHFSNTINSDGTIDGTVYGHVTGVVDNATSAATGVFIDSYPAALPGIFNVGDYVPPFDVLSTWHSGELDENSFTLVGGHVVDAAFSLVFANGDNDRLYLNSKCDCTGETGHTNFISIGSNNSQYVWNVGDLNAADGLIFTSGVPEPAVWATMIMGFGLIGGQLRRRRSPATTLRVSFS